MCTFLVEPRYRPRHADCANRMAFDIEHWHRHRKAVVAQVIGHHRVTTGARQVPLGLHRISPAGRAAGSQAAHPFIQNPALARRIQVGCHGVAQRTGLDRQQLPGARPGVALAAGFLAGHHHHFFLIQRRQQNRLTQGVTQRGEFVLRCKAQIEVTPDLVRQLEQAESKLEGFVVRVMPQQPLTGQRGQGTVQRRPGQPGHPQQLGKGHGCPIGGHHVQQTHGLFQYTHAGRHSVGRRLRCGSHSGARRHAAQGCKLRRSLVHSCQITP